MLRTVQAIGGLMREIMANVYSPICELYEDKIPDMVIMSLCDNEFLEFIKLEPDFRLEEKQVPDFLMSIGIKLMLHYQHERFEYEAGIGNINAEEMDDILFTAMAFTQTSDKMRKNRRGK